MYYKCGLSIRGVIYDATNDLKNWDEVKYTLSRSDYGGTVRSFTTAFTFTGDSYLRLLNEYRANGLDFSASIAFYTRTNSWEWKEEFVQRLDVSTLNYTSYDISLNAIDDSVEAIIKAGKGTQYEYEVENYQEEKLLMYDGIEMENSVSWDISGDVKDDGNVEVSYDGLSIGDDRRYFYLPLFMLKEDSVANRFIVYTDSGIGAAPKKASEAQWILSAYGGSVTITPDYSIELKITDEWTYPIVYNAGLYVHRSGSDNYEMYSGALDIQKGSFRKIESSNTGPITLNDGDSIGFLIEYQWDTVLAFKVEIKSGSYFKINWNSRRQAIRIPVIKPETMLNCLLKSMNGGKDGITGKIMSSGNYRLTTAYLLAAESIRGINNAKIYSSFQQFMDWMETVFGFVYYIDGNNVIFVPREDLFDNEVVKTINNFSDFTYSVNKSLIYSQVNVGYEKQDYDSTNGRYEWNFTNYYTTGMNINDAKLELQSPYRADCYGVEILADTRGSETSDTESDNDLFFVGLVGRTDNYYLDRSISVEGVPSSVFNAGYAPDTCIEANKSYLAASIKKLIYASSDGNSDVKIDGNYLNRDIEITGGLFTVGEIQFDTDDLVIPDNWNGVIEIVHNGNTYHGYISDVDKTYTKEQSVSYKLIESKN